MRSNLRTAILAILVFAGAGYLNSASATTSKGTKDDACDVYASGYAHGYCKAMNDNYQSNPSYGYTCNPDGTANVQWVQC